jgi:hypothetical protein
MLSSSKFKLVGLNIAPVIIIAASTLDRANMASAATPGVGVNSYWPLDNSTTDIVGGRNGTLLGDAKFSTEVPTKLKGFSTHSLSLDGAIDKMFYNVQPGDYVTNEFTLSLWLKNLRTDWYSAFVGTRSPIEGGFDAKFDRDRQRIYTDIGSDTSLRSTYSTPGSVSANVWHHIAITVSPGLQIVYVDGSPFDVHPFSSDFTPVLFDSNHDIAIGAIHGNSNDEDFHGLIDDVRIFGKVLTPQEVRGLANVPEPQFLELLAIAGLCTVALRRQHQGILLGPRPL